MLVKLQFQSGLNADGSRYSGTGQWVDGDMVRFRQGSPEKIGGWQRSAPAAAAIGIPRSLIAWTTLAGNSYLGIGTAAAYWIEFAQTYYEITPYRRQVVLANPVSTVFGSPTLTIADVAHGAVVGSFVTISGAALVGGLDVNRRYAVATVVGPNSYTVTHPLNAAGTVTGGGATVTLSYDLPAGLDTSSFGTGWGSGPYGGLGNSSTTGWGDSTALVRMRLWSADTFGQDLVLNPRDGDLYYWSAAGGLALHGVPLTSMTGAAGVPTTVRQIMVTDQDRRLIAFGATDAATGQQDTLLIRWTDAENPVDWTPTDINSAGDLRIPSGAEFVAARETKQEILVWTDDSLHSLRYVGPPYIYGINRIGQTSLIAPNAVAVANDQVFWMGVTSFFRYDGRIAPLPSQVHDFVFNDINLDQADKITAGSNISFNEVSWFYCSAGSQENDRQVTYNYVENHWTYTSLARTAWIDRIVEDYPRAGSPTGYIFFHEIGNDDGSTNPVSGINAFVESGPVEIGQGEDFGFAWRILPDVGFRNSTGTPAVSMVLKAQNSAGGNFVQTETNAVTRTATLSIEQFTEQCWFRLRGRALTLRVESSGTGVAWRLGTPRIDVRADGKRG
jgi:hypothetical protein